MSARPTPDLVPQRPNRVPVVILVRPENPADDHSDAIGAALRAQDHLERIAIESADHVEQAQARYRELIALDPEWPVVVLPANDLARQYVRPLAETTVFPENLQPTALIIDPDEDRAEVALDFHRGLGVDPTYCMTTANALDYLAQTRDFQLNFARRLHALSNTVSEALLRQGGTVCVALSAEDHTRIPDRALPALKTLLDALRTFAVSLEDYLKSLRSVVREQRFARDHRDYFSDDQFYDYCYIFCQNHLKTFTPPFVHACQQLLALLRNLDLPHDIDVLSIQHLLDLIADAQDVHAFNCPPFGLVFVAADMDPHHPDGIAVRFANRNDGDLEDDFADKAVRAVCEFEAAQGYPAAIKVCVGDFGDAHRAMMKSGAPFCAAVDGRLVSLELFYALSPSLFNRLDRTAADDVVAARVDRRRALFPPKDGSDDENYFDAGGDDIQSTSSRLGGPGN